MNLGKHIEEVLRTSKARKEKVVIRHVISADSINLQIKLTL